MKQGDMIKKKNKYKRRNAVNAIHTALHTPSPSVVFHVGIQKVNLTTACCLDDSALVGYLQTFPHHLDYKSDVWLFPAVLTLSCTLCESGRVSTAAFIMGRNETSLLFCLMRNLWNRWSCSWKEGHECNRDGSYYVSAWIEWGSLFYYVFFFNVITEQSSCHPNKQIEWTKPPLPITCTWQKNTESALTDWRRRKKIINLMTRIRWHGGLCLWPTN